MAEIAAIGEDLTGDESAYALRKLADLVDLWATNRLAIYRSQRAGPFNVVATTQSYTIGAGATWNVARPLWIDGAGVLIDGGATNPVELPVDVLTKRQWQQIPVKSTRSALPRRLWYDRAFAAGFGTIYLYPVPNVSTPDIILYLPIAVTEFATLAETVSLPPGYRMALISNLAVILKMGMGPISPEVADLARSSLGQLKSGNLVEQMDPLECDPAVLGGGSPAFNYHEG